MSRVSDAVLSREKLLQDFFGGWIPSDVELLQKYAHALEGVPASGELIDWLGVRTDLQMHTWLPKPADGILQVLGLPVPDDMVHAEAIEYVALAMAMEPVTVRSRDQAQAWLQFKGYEPTTLRLGPLTRMGGRVGSANIAFDDHPNEKRFSDRIETVTVDSVLAWMQRTQLAAAPVVLTIKN